jgi:hypothetical protein
MIDSSPTCDWCLAPKKVQSGLCGQCHRFPPMQSFDRDDVAEARKMLERDEEDDVLATLDILRNFRGPS